MNINRPGPTPSGWRPGVATTTTSATRPMPPATRSSTALRATLTRSRWWIAWCRHTTPGPILRRSTQSRFMAHHFPSLAFAIRGLAAHILSRDIAREWTCCAGIERD